MNTTTAALLANALSFVVCILISAWYAAPWLRSVPQATALTALLWVHIGRHVALQIFSAQRAGFAVPDGLRNEIAAGDVVGMALALLAIIALRYRFSGAIALVWVFVAETLYDLANALSGGLRAGMIGAASGVTWMILAFYVPVLWVSLFLLVWQLIVRRREALG